MISERYKFLFIHYGKGAGNSIASLLLPYSDDRVVVDPSYQDGIQRFNVVNDKFITHKHSTLREYSDRLTPDLFKNLYKFAVIRNPFDRLVSAYFSPHHYAKRSIEGFDKKRFYELIHSMPPIRSFICLSPNAGFMDDINRLLIFENLNQDFSALCHDLRLPYMTLPKLNRNIRGHYRNYYDIDSINAVKSRFAEEIEYGKYIF